MVIGSLTIANGSISNNTTTKNQTFITTFESRMLFEALVIDYVSIAISNAFSNTITKIKENIAFFAKAGDGISEHIKNKTKGKWDKHSKKRPGDKEKGDRRRNENRIDKKKRNQK